MNENIGCGKFGSYFLTMLLLIAGGVVLKAFVVMKMWGWFITPLGLPYITMIHAYGLTVILHLLTGSYQGIDEKGHLENSKDIKKILSKTCEKLIVYPLFCLLVAWILHTQM